MDKKEDASRPVGPLYVAYNATNTALTPMLPPMETSKLSQAAWPVICSVMTI